LNISSQIRDGRPKLAPLCVNEKMSKMKMAISADAIAAAIGYAIGQPANVDVSEILIRPTAQPN
jgi:NADP-dependent 3-hydroxy acid dehydrogenase YdfG